MTTLIVTKPKVEIGKRYSTRREVHYDTRSGTYEEMNPIMDIYAFALQHALCPDALPKRRAPEKVRQPA
jgi:hypothetical protein